MFSQMCLLLLLNFALIIHARKYDCFSNNYTIYLPSNELAYFNSTLSVIDGTGCNLIFIYLNNTNSTNVKLHFMEFELENSRPVPKFQTSDFTNFVTGKTPQYEGYLIFDDSIYDCPLESISRINPYHFIDETQILYLRNGYNDKNPTNISCRWQFTSPPDYGFKFVVEVYVANENSFFKVMNRTDMLMNERSVKLYHAIYNSDNYLDIQLSLNNSKHNLQFQAFVSIVKNNFTKIDGNCTLKRNGDGSVSWTINPHIYMYANNIKCSQDFCIINGTETVFDFDRSLFIRDQGGDYVGYYTEKGKDIQRFPPRIRNDSIYSQSAFYGEYTLKLAPYKNGTTRCITWEFVSDGSFPSYGFDMIVYPLACDCGRKKVPCNTLTGLSNTTSQAVFNSRIYCGNIQCEYILEPCSSSITRLTIYLSLDFDFNPLTYFDTFEIFSNDSLVYTLQYSSANEEQYSIYLNSANNNILKATTFYTEILKGFDFITVPITPPSIFAKALLTPSNSSYVVDVGFHDLIFVEISEEYKLYNYSFVIHRYRYAEILLFTDKSLTTPLKEECLQDNTGSSFFVCTVNNYKTFVVYGSNISSTPLFSYPYAIIQASNITRKCVFENTLFHKNTVDYETTGLGDDVDHGQNLTISAISNPYEPCTLTFLIDSINFLYFFITKLWTTSHNENVKIFAGEHQNISLLEFNSKSQNFWNNILLTSAVYTVEIPKNSSLLMIVSSANRYPNIFIPNKSILAAPCFGTSFSEQCNYHTAAYSTDKSGFKITALYYGKTMPKQSVILSIYQSGINYDSYLNAAGDFHVFYDATVLIGFYYGGTKAPDGIILLIEALNKTNINPNYLF